MSVEEKEPSSSKAITEAVKAFTKESMKAVAAATRLSNELPAQGGYYEVYNANARYSALMSAERDRLTAIMVDMLNGANVPTGRQLAASHNQETSDQIELLLAANDKLFERVANALDEAEGLRRREHSVAVPGTKRTINAANWLAYKAEIASSSKQSETSKLNINASAPKLQGSVIEKELGRKASSRRAPIVDNDLEKPQMTFAKHIDNTDAPFVSKLRVKHHAGLMIEESAEGAGLRVIDAEESLTGTEIAERSANWPSDEQRPDSNDHPYTLELQHFTPTEEELQPVVPVLPRPIDLTPPILVDTEEALRNLVATLNEQKSFAFDVEHHQMRSYLGITCLLQVSTRDADYIVDPFPLWEHMHLLNEPFADRRILKVAHGADSDVLWLQRDFGVHIVNLFDTYRAMHTLAYPKLSLEHLVKERCKIDLNKEHRLADWRVRPLPPDMQRYAQSDAHYLLYLHDILHNEILEAGGAEMLTNVLLASRNTCALVFSKPSFNAYAEVQRMLKISARKGVAQSLTPREHYAARLLAQWRDTVARLEDESVHYVMPSTILLQLASVLPREQSSVFACCWPEVPPLVRQHVDTIQSLITTARDVSEEKLAQLEETARLSAQDETTLIVSLCLWFIRQFCLILQSMRAQRLAWLYTPHDFSCIGEDEDLLVVPRRFKSRRSTMLVPKEKRARLVKKEAEQTSAAPNARVYTLRMYDAKEAAVNRANYYKEAQKARIEMVTPHEQYLMAISRLEAQKKAQAERAARKATGQTSEQKEEAKPKRFSHHDPSTGRSVEVTETQSTIASEKTREEGELSPSGNEPRKETPPFFDDYDMMSKRQKKKYRQWRSAQADMNLSEEPPTQRLRSDVQPFDYERHRAQQGKQSAQGSENVYMVRNSGPSNRGKKRNRSTHGGAKMQTVFRL